MAVAATTRVRTVWSPGLILKIQRSAPEARPPTAPSLRANRRNGIGCFPTACLLDEVRRARDRHIQSGLDGDGRPARGEAGRPSDPGGAAVAVQPTLYVAIPHSTNLVQQTRRRETPDSIA